MTAALADDELKVSRRVTDEQRARIIALREAGHMTNYEIAIAVGVSDASCANVLFRWRKQQAAK